MLSRAMQFSREKKERDVDYVTTTYKNRNSHVDPATVIR